jgi:predicted GH43/DUF377 family glycosyl hydrolase
MVYRALLLCVAALVLLGGVAVAIAPSGAPSIQRAGADSQGWRDEFTDSTGVGAYSGVVLTGRDVRLPATSGSMVRRGLVVPTGPGWESLEVGAPVVIFDEGVYKMWYFGGPGGSTWSLGYATSLDGSNWTKHGVVVSPTLSLEGSAIAYPEVLKIAGEYKMWYSAGGGPYRIFFANSTDGITWTKHGVVLDLGPPGSQETFAVYSPSILYDGGTYKMWYSALVPSWTQIPTFYATSRDGLTWARHGVVLPTGPPGSLDSVAAYNPSVIRRDSQYEMVYSGYGGSPYTGRLLHARSTDGVNWTKLGLVLDALPPNEGVVDWPCVLIEPDGSWKVYYQARGSNLQIYLVTRSPDSGWLQSIRIPIPSGGTWSRLDWAAVVPSNTTLTLTVRDATTLVPLPGLEGITAPQADLSGVDAAAHPSVLLEVRMVSYRTSTPQLDSWAVRWSTPAPQGILALPFLWVIPILLAAIAFAAYAALRGRRRGPDGAPPT